jgi:hypothetical protein
MKVYWKWASGTEVEPSEPYEQFTQYSNLHDIRKRPPKCELTKI